MEDCVINCGGPIESSLADTTEAGGGTEAAALAAAALRTDLPEDAATTTTNSLSEVQPDLLVTTLAAQNGTTIPRVGTTTAAVALRPTEAPGRNSYFTVWFFEIRTQRAAVTARSIKYEKFVVNR
jgi:hypothetical protein